MFEYPVQQAVGVGGLSNMDSVEHVSAAVRRADADHLVLGLPNGVRTQLRVTWESGVGLPHGQWKRIALARAYKRDIPLVLILEESASSLDAKTEHALFGRYSHVVEADRRVHAGGMTILHRPDGGGEYSPDTENGGAISSCVPLGAYDSSNSELHLLDMCSSKMTSSPCWYPYTPSND